MIAFERLRRRKKTAIECYYLFGYTEFISIDSINSR